MQNQINKDIQKTAKATPFALVLGGAMLCGHANIISVPREAYRDNPTVRIVISKNSTSGSAFGTATVDSRASDVESRFQKLAAEWKRVLRGRSNIEQATMHPAHLDILKMGQAAIPLILNDLKHHGGHWYLTLRMLAQSSPVPRENAGNIPKMKEAWLNWGRENGYIS